MKCDKYEGFSAASSTCGSEIGAETQAVLKEELRKARHRNAQRRYKSKLQQERRETEQVRDKAMLQYQQAMEEVAEKDAVIEEMKIAMAKQKEDLKLLRKQLKVHQKFEEWQGISTGSQNSFHLNAYEPYQGSDFKGQSKTSSRESNFSSCTSDVISHGNSFWQDEDLELYEESGCEPLTTTARASSNDINYDKRCFSSEPFLFTQGNWKDEDLLSESFDASFASSLECGDVTDNFHAFYDVDRNKDKKRIFLSEPFDLVEYSNPENEGTNIDVFTEMPNFRSRRN